MDWLQRLGRRYFAVLAPLVAVVPAVFCLGLTGDWHDYMPSPALPDTFLGLGLVPNDDGAVQMAFAGDDTPQMFSVFDYPFPGLPVRNIFSSRSASLGIGLDPRLFRDEIAAHEIELKLGPDEMANVELASAAIDGVVVRPFEVFSFNAVVGERSAERGFQPGLMFSNGEAVSGLGGGICIVSTGLYNAVLKGGYRIIERTHHSGPVRYAEPGLDSAVVYGVKDLRFKNDTISPVMIRSRIEGDRLVISLRGRNRSGFDVAIVKKGYKELPYEIVEKEDPDVPEGTIEVEVPARSGFEVTTVRVFRQDGKVVKREVISYDRVTPRDKIILVPPKPPRHIMVEIDADPESPPSAAPLPEPVSPPVVESETQAQEAVQQ